MLSFPEGIQPENKDQYVVKVSKDGNEIKIEDNRGIHKVSNWFGRHIFSGKWSYKLANIENYISKHKTSKEADSLSAQDPNSQLQNWVSFRSESDRNSRWNKACAEIKSWFQHRNVRQLSPEDVGETSATTNKTSAQSPAINSSNPVQDVKSAGEKEHVTLSISTPFDGILNVKIDGKTTIKDLKQQVVDQYKKESPRSYVTEVLYFMGVPYLQVAKDTELVLDLIGKTSNIRVYFRVSTAKSTVINSNNPVRNVKNASKRENATLSIKPLGADRFNIQVNKKTTVGELKQQALKEYNTKYPSNPATVVVFHQTEDDILHYAEDTDLVLDKVNESGNIDMLFGG